MSLAIDIKRTDKADAQAELYLQSILATLFVFPFCGSLIIDMTQVPGCHFE